MIDFYGRVTVEVGALDDQLILNSICGVLDAIKHTTVFTPEMVIIATEVTLAKYGLTGTDYTLAPLFKGFPISGTLAASSVWIRDHWDLASGFLERVGAEVQEQLNTLMLGKAERVFDTANAEEFGDLKKILCTPNPLQLVIRACTVGEVQG